MAKIRKSPSYLLRIGTIYHFRYVTPARYTGIMSGEVRLSLGTGLLTEARPKAAEDTHKNEIVALLKVGVPKVRVANKYGVMTTTLYNWIKKNGINDAIS